MKPSLAWKTAASLSRTSLRPQCLLQIRPRVLTEKLPCKHSPTWINRLHTSSHRLKDLEAIRKVVLEVSSHAGEMPKREVREALAHLDKDDQRTARKKIKLAARQRRKEARAANMQRQKEAGGAELEPLPKNVAKKARKGKKAKRKQTSAFHDPKLQGASSMSKPSGPGEVDRP